jgi:predicted transcriptional regulator
MHTETMSVKIRPQDKERLKSLAASKKRTPHWLAKEAIAQFLDREEAVERFRQESLEEVEEFKRTGESVPNEQVLDWLATWGDADETEGP